jgi:hypothetical protein
MVNEEFEKWHLETYGDLDYSAQTKYAWIASAERLTAKHAEKDARIAELEAQINGLLENGELGPCGKHPKMFNTFDGLIQGINGLHKCTICAELDATARLKYEVSILRTTCDAHIHVIESHDNDLAATRAAVLRNAIPYLQDGVMPGSSVGADIHEIIEALITQPDADALAEVKRQARESTIDECIEVLQGRVTREEYGHAKAAVCLDIEALNEIRAPVKQAVDAVCRTCGNDKVISIYNKKLDTYDLKDCPDCHGTGKEQQFCLSCGAGLGKFRRIGEGTCEHCFDK